MKRPKKDAEQLSIPVTGSEVVGLVPLKASGRDNRRRRRLLLRLLLVGRFRGLGEGLRGLFFLLRSFFLLFEDGVGFIKRFLDLIHLVLGASITLLDPLLERLKLLRELLHVVAVNIGRSDGGLDLVAERIELVVILLGNGLLLGPSIGKLLSLNGLHPLSTTYMDLLVAGPLPDFRR